MEDLCKTFVWSMLLNGSDYLTLRKREKFCLEAAVTWMWQRMTKTYWTDRKSNVEVLGQVKEKSEPIKVIGKRKIQLLDYLIRYNSLIGNILEGKERKRLCKGEISG